MISQEKFNEIEMEFGCGYWNLCWEHACPCAIITENKGLTEKIYNEFIEENKEICEHFDEWFKDELDDYRCNICGRPSELCDCDDNYEDTEYYMEDRDFCNYCDNCGNSEEHEFIDLGNDLFKCPKCNQLYTEVNGFYKMLSGVSIS